MEDDLRESVVATVPLAAAAPGPKREEVRPLTGLRGLAALMVAIYHIDSELIGPTPIGRLVGKGYLWVDLFFVLSGFVLAMNYGELFAEGWSMRCWGEFLLKRAARTYPLYLFILLPSTAYAAVLGSIQLSPHLPKPTPLPHPAIDVAANLALVQSWGVGPSIDGTAWSLSTEWAAYYLFPFLAAHALYSRRRVAVGFTLVAAALAVTTALLTRYDGAYHSGPLDAYNGTTIEPLLRCLGGFGVGMISYRIACSRRSCAWLGRDAALLCILALIGLGTSSGANDLLIYPLFAPLVLGLYRGDGFIARVLANGFLYRAGLLSYSIYLLHPFLVAPHHGLVGEFDEWLPAPWAAVLASAGTFAMLVAISEVTYRWIERPGRRWVQQLGGDVLGRA
jgi:peptidoglycan/LPS O-acetylase OafA/YrhL